MELKISTTPPFSFSRSGRRHGWYVLPPCEFEESTWTLVRVLDVGQTKPLTVTITATRGGMLIKPSRRVSTKAADKIVRDGRHMFRLDADMTDFYQAVAAEPEFAWIAAEGAGRLLRSPAVFGDLVGMLCTTNCSWALTEKMVQGLVNELGEQADDGRKTFPTAEALAQKPEKNL